MALQSNFDLKRAYQLESFDDLGIKDFLRAIEINDSISSSSERQCR